MVKEGDRVRERQVIARISDRDYRAQVQQTRAQIVRAKAQLMTLETGPTRVEIDVAQAAVKRARERLQFEQARVDRSKLLYERDILSLMEYENALQQLNAAHNDLNEAQKQLTALVRGVRQEQLDAARAEIEELESQLRIYESNLQRVEIRSHAAGIVATPARQLRELLYQKVDRGSLIARVSNAKKLVVEIAVSEKDIGEIAIGQRVAFKARAFPDDTFYGVVTATAQTAGATAPAPAQQGTPAAAQAPSPNPTTILVTSEIDNASLKLKPGMTGQAKIFAGERRIISLIFRRLMQMVKVEFWSWW
jgi:multidrug resistance efflux pump